MQLVKLACERPELRGRSLAPWDCRELACQLMQEGRVEHISPETVRRILAHHNFKPWRSPLWLSAQPPRDDAVYARIRVIIARYSRPLAPFEIVLSVDEKTSLQPRPRRSATQPA